VWIVKTVVRGGGGDGYHGAGLSRGDTKPRARRGAPMKQNFEWLEVLGRGMSGVCRKVRDRDGQILVVKQIDLSFVTREEHQNATRYAGEFVSSSPMRVAACLFTVLMPCLPACSMQVRRLCTGVAALLVTPNVNVHT
jgi:hypothetical protein